MSEKKPRKKMSKEAVKRIADIVLSLTLLAATVAMAIMYSKVADENEKLQRELDDANLIVDDFMSVDGATVTHF